MSKFPFFNNPNAMMGGACCLKMIAMHYGKSFFVQRLYRSMNPGNGGITLFDLANAAESIGFNTVAIEWVLDDLKEKAPMPCIVHWESRYFVVVYKIGRQHIFLADPLLGMRKLAIGDFMKGWSSAWINKDKGIALLLEPTPGFYEKYEDPREEKRKTSIWATYYERMKKKNIVRRRKNIRNRIISTPASPLPVREDDLLYVHMLLGKSHVEMAICSCKSFILAAKSSCIFTFHDDGSLDKESIGWLLSQFPGSRVIDRQSADRIAAQKLKDYPMCRYVRDNNFMWIKFFDVFFWSGRNRVAYIDSDIIFFNKPEQFIRELNDQDGNNLFNRDVGTGYYYSISLDKIEQLIKKKMLPAVNAGLWILDRSVLDLDLVESWLSDDGLKNVLSHYFLDQTLIAALASVTAKQATYFDKGYDISLTNEVKDAVCKHYVGSIRQNYELEGLIFLIKESDFLTKWGNFLRNS